MIRGIHHVAVHTPNLERLVRFYCDVIGFTVIARAEWAQNEFIDTIIGVPGSAAKQAMLRAGNCHVEIFEYAAPAARPGGPLRPSDHGYTHLCLDVVDIEAEYDRLTAAGMTFNRRPGDFGAIKAVYGRDPDGNVIEIQQTTPDEVTSMRRLGTLTFD